MRAAGFPTFHRRGTRHSPVLGRVAPRFLAAPRADILSGVSASTVRTSLASLAIGATVRVCE